MKRKRPGKPKFPTKYGPDVRPFEPGEKDYEPNPERRKPDRDKLRKDPKRFDE